MWIVLLWSLAFANEDLPSLEHDLLKIEAVLKQLPDSSAPSSQEIRTEINKAYGLLDILKRKTSQEPNLTKEDLVKLKMIVDRIKALSHKKMSKPHEFKSLHPVLLLDSGHHKDAIKRASLKKKRQALEKKPAHTFFRQEKKEDTLPE